MDQWNSGPHLIVDCCLALLLLVVLWFCTDRVDQLTEAGRTQDWWELVEKGQGPPGLGPVEWRLGREPSLTNKYALGHYGGPVGHRQG